MTEVLAYGTAVCTEIHRGSRAHHAISFNEAESCKMEFPIRTEQPADCAAIRPVLLSAFPIEQETNLVDRLRRNGRLMISLVAVSAGEIVGRSPSAR